ncbi:hypothetical protein [Leucobacter chromiireducens]|uniref:hypothetical protein n=1 Tax=Leucobacter chromiireducens TaxID=283877 RepID=UPI000F64086A|nr:hypothetical protein [Leucobacter chromiireducens]
MSHLSSPSLGRKRAVIAGGAVLIVAGLATAAAFTDFANLNIGNGTDDSGIGGNNRFNIQVVGTDGDGLPVPGTWQEANTVEGVNVNVPGADVLTPGDTVSVEIPFRNESPVLSADMDFTLQDRPGKTSDPLIRDLLEYTVLLNGTPLVSGADQDAVNSLDLGIYTTGAEGVVTLSVTLPNQPTESENNALQGQVSYVQAHFDASSVQP